MLRRIYFFIDLCLLIIIGAIVIIQKREFVNWKNVNGRVYVNGEAVKYSDFLHMSNGIHGFFDYDQALKFAQAWEKPLLLLFTGHGCFGSREVEFTYSHPEFAEILNKEYVVVALYVDDKAQLLEKERYISSYDGKEKKTIGKKNADFQLTKFNTNCQPYYVLLDSRKAHEEDLIPHMLAPHAGCMFDHETIARFLQMGIEEFKKRQK